MLLSENGCDRSSGIYSKRNSKVATINHIMWDKYSTFSLRILALSTFSWDILGQDTLEKYQSERPNLKYFILFYTAITLVGGQIINFGWRPKGDLCSIFLKRCSHGYLSQNHAEHYFKYKYVLSRSNLEGIHWFKGTFWRCKQDIYW